MMEIQASDLLYVNEIAKTIKQKDFVWYKNKILNVFDNNIIIETNLDMSKLSYYPTRPVMMNYTEFRNFCKSVISSVPIDELPKNNVAKLVLSNQFASLDIHLSSGLDMSVNHVLEIIRTVNSSISGPSQEITDIIKPLFKASKTSGNEKYIIDNHIMYLSSTSIPLRSNSKVYINILDRGNTFIAKFTVKNPTNIIHTYLNFLKL